MKFKDSIGTLLRDGEQRLRPYFDSARLDAEVLLATVLDKSRVYLYSWPDKQLSTSEYRNYYQFIDLRIGGEPISYITGNKEFWSLDFKVTRDTLIPRAETELAVEIALGIIEQDSHCHVIDLGTGAGVIAVTLGKHRPGVRVVAVDASIEALQVAQINADQHHVENIQFVQSSWCQSILPDSIDVIITNPPYVALDDPHLTQGDVRFEPRVALVSGPDGMADINTIAKQGCSILKLGGHIIIEHGYDQQSAVLNLLDYYGYSDINTYTDLANVPRAVSAINSKNKLQR